MDKPKTTHSKQRAEDFSHISPGQTWMDITPEKKGRLRRISSIDQERKVAVLFGHPLMEIPFSKMHRTNGLGKKSGWVLWQQAH